MSAAEVIEQIKKLPPEERRKVCSFVVTEFADNRTVPDDEFKAIAAKVFDRNEELFRKLAQ